MAFINLAFFKGSGKMETIKVSCAIIFEGTKLLACQNSSFARHPLKWEFPGGKIEENESEIECLKRELKEELAVEVEVVKKHTSIFYNYDDFRLELIPFEVRIRKHAPIAKVHDKIKWIKLATIDQLDWAETDRELILRNAELFQIQA